MAAPVLAQFPKVSNVYGMIALQKTLYEAALASPTHTWLLDEINVTEDMCGSDTFTTVNDYMVPINDDTRREAKADYDAHLNSLDPQPKLDKFLPVLLHLGKIKNLFTNQDLPKTDFMEDMIAQMKLVDGANKDLGWGNEITAWCLELAVDKLQKEYNDTAIVGHFEKKLRVIETSAKRAKTHAQKNGSKVFKNAYQGVCTRNYQLIAARKYNKPCSWCDKNLGKEFYGHSVNECRNKNKNPPDCAPPDDGGGRGDCACHLCNAGRDGTPFHTASSCPKAADFQAFIEQRAQLVEQIKSVENKDRATTAPADTDGKYSVCPSNTSVPFAFARNHATQASLLPTREC
jgi:hypothetical protein